MGEQDQLAPVFDHYADFLRRLRIKLEHGARRYGEASFDRPVLELLDELEAEALDLAGWGFVLFVKIERLRAKVRKAVAT